MGLGRLSILGQGGGAEATLKRLETGTWLTGPFKEGEVPLGAPLGRWGLTALQRGEGRSAWRCLALR